MLARNFDRCVTRARNRGGQPYQAPPVLNPETGLPRNGRCKLHGGRQRGHAPWRDGSKSPMRKGGAAAPEQLNDSVWPLAA